MVSQSIRNVLCLIVMVSLVEGATERFEGPFVGPLGRQYWLGFPHGYDSTKTYWLVAAAHGFGGTGDQMKAFTIANSRKDYIVVAPSFPQSHKDGFYQTLGGGSDKQLIDLFGDLRKRFHLQDKIFLYGFSGGAQFSHRFAMAHPEVVVGCSAHSGGTWGPEVSKKALGIPFFLSCGLNDTSSSTDGDPSRIQCAETYFKQMLAHGAFAKMRYWAGVGHSPGPKVALWTAECYELSTTGLYPCQRAAIDAELARIDGMIKDGMAAEAKKALLALPKFKLQPPGKKALVFSTSTKEEQETNRATFIAEGIGGKVGGDGPQNRDLWIDDRYENVYGYNDTTIARAALAAQFRNWLAERSAERMPLVSEKKPSKKTNKPPSQPATVLRAP